jgi:hypothetical protein
VRSKLVDWTLSCIRRHFCCVPAGRALELGRELLHKWGYKRVDELIWVKTNSLRRLIITGRTGHWLNHSKEHCLVGYKGRPAINRYVLTQCVKNKNAGAVWGLGFRGVLCGVRGAHHMCWLPLVLGVSC